MVFICVYLNLIVLSVIGQGELSSLSFLRVAIIHEIPFVVLYLLDLLGGGLAGGGCKR